ncbi:MAG: HhH-GPD-type base excision DNA repair protein, partial [Frankia sp.]
MGLNLSRDPAADALLDDDPMALLIGMVLDQQIPLERAFAAPYELTKRLGQRLDAHVLATADPDVLAEVFSRQPALHRFPGSM